MERAFRPKAPKERVNDRTESAEGVALVNIEKERKEIDAFKKIIDAGISGKLTPKVITALSDSDATYNNNGVLVIGSSPVLEGGFSVSKSSTGGALLTQEQSNFIVSVVERNNSQRSAFEIVNKNTQSLANIVTPVLARKLTPKVITALSNPDATYNNNGVLVIGSSSVLEDGFSVSKSSTGGALLTQEQGGVFKVIAERQVKDKIEFEKAISEADAFSRSYRAIVEGKLSKKVFTALSNPDATYNNNGVLVIGSSSVLEDGFSVSKSSIGGAFFATQEQRELFDRLYKTLNDSAYPEEVRGRLKDFLNKGEFQDKQRLDAVILDTATEEQKAEVRSVLDDLGAVGRRTAIKEKIYQLLVKDTSAKALADELALFEPLDQEDLVLAQTLKDSITVRRREEILKDASANLNPDTLNVSELGEVLKPLLGSKDEEDVRAGVEFLKAGYRSELATYKTMARSIVVREKSFDDVRLLIDSFSIRPSFAGLDYVEEISKIQSELTEEFTVIEDYKRREQILTVREQYKNTEPLEMLGIIDALPQETVEDQALRRSIFEEYKKYVAVNRPDFFDKKFGEEIREREIQGLKERFARPELGKNKRAFNYMRERFVETVFPLVESLRADGTTADDVASVLDRPTKMNGEVVSPRRKFEQRVSAFQEQRPLTDTERAYLESVELLSVFNPYLIAAISADPGTTNEFLRHHFDTLSENTLANLQDGDYIPLLQIGTGPNGIAAFGELVRNNPALAENTLVVDAGEQPGGPFAIPKGAAWELNSANSRGNGAPSLPDQPNGDEIKTVRAYGSPLRWYPGERRDNGDIRQGSINTTVDYLPTPDNLSGARYPTNEELQSVLSLQTAMLVKNLALETRVVSVDPNPDEEDAGDKIVTLQVGGKDGYQLKIKTDAIFASTGLGEPGFGFKLEGSKAEQILRDTENSAGFPKISQTLEAFEALANRSGEDLSPGETLVIYGKGNSADTLIEYIGNIFQGDNPRVRDVTKIYVVAEGDLSARPRYSQINDIRPRNGRGNLIEQIPGRVADVGYATLESAPEERQLVILDATGQPIKDKEGRPILADSVIAATGFRSELDSILDAYAMKKAETAPTLRTPLNLPTNEAVPVADTLSTDPNVLILGVASRPQFNKLAKLNQLPKEPRDALLRNGAENAVAIGFRAPDTQAAVNIWLNSKEVLLPEGEMTSRKEIPLTSGLGERVREGETMWLNRTVDPRAISVPNNITNEIRLLSPLLAYEIGNKIEAIDRNGRPLTGEITFEMTSNPDQMLGLTLTGGQEEVSGEAYQTIKSACENKDFQKYAFVALQKKRRNQKLDMVISFKNGKVDPRNTFVQS